MLMEVLLALLLFVGAAAVITGGLSASLTSVERLRLSTHAANLAITVLSELQLGLRTTDLAGPEPFEPPFEHWTWELVTTPASLDAEDDSPLTTIEVIIRHDEPPLTHRLCQLVRLGEPVILEAPLAFESSDE